MAGFILIVIIKGCKNFKDTIMLDFSMFGIIRLILSITFYKILKINNYYLLMQYICKKCRKKEK